MWYPLGDVWKRVDSLNNHVAESAVKLIALTVVRTAYPQSLGFARAMVRMMHRQLGTTQCLRGEVEGVDTTLG